MRYTNHVVMTEPSKSQKQLTAQPFLVNKTSLLNKLVMRRAPWCHGLFLKLNNFKYANMIKENSHLTPLTYPVVNNFLQSKYMVNFRGKVFHDFLSKDVKFNNLHKDVLLEINKKDLTNDEDLKIKNISKEKFKRFNSSKWVFNADINFLKKEFVYTKLKYSRSPQYDTVSGGFAALLAGFIGFLISEKFGIELVDSGDFFIVLMYALFLGFTVRLLFILGSDVSAPYLAFNFYTNKFFFKELFLFIIKRALNFKFK